MINIHIIPAILAFIATAYILVISSKNQSKFTTFTAMVLVFLIHHACEILSFIEFFKSRHMLLILKLYYIATVLFLAIILVYVTEVCKLDNQYIKKTIYITATPLSLLVLFSDLIITDSISLGYVMTAVKGTHYFLFQLMAISLLLITLILLIIRSKKAPDHITEIRCLYMLLAFTPLLIALISILVLMAIGFKINAIAIIPIATTLFLIITAKNESQHKLTDIRRFMPFSPERKTSQEIMELYSRYAQDEISYRDCMAEIEKLMVMHKYSKSGKNASATAELMGMPRSSLYSIFNRLKIDVKKQ